MAILCWNGNRRSTSFAGMPLKLADNSSQLRNLLETSAGDGMELTASANSGIKAKLIFAPQQPALFVALSRVRTTLISLARRRDGEGI
jgi:hypothetical protein